jgi:hypothetical protein
MKYVSVIAAVGALATPTLADEVGVRVGPVGAGITVGEGHRDIDRDLIANVPPYSKSESRLNAPQLSKRIMTTTCVPRPSSKIATSAL